MVGLLGDLIWNKRASAGTLVGAKSSEASSGHGCMTCCCVEGATLAAGWVMALSSVREGMSCGQAATHIEVPDEMYVALAIFRKSAPPKFLDPGPTNPP
jgi:hypothetical protein